MVGEIGSTSARVVGRSADELGAAAGKMARAAADGIAAKLASRGVDPNAGTGMVSVLVTKSGKLYYGVNAALAKQLGLDRKLIEDVSNVLENIGERRGGYGATCSECHAISEAIDNGEDLNGAVISNAQVGTRPVGGAVVEPGSSRSSCTTCQELTDTFGVTVY